MADLFFLPFRPVYDSNMKVLPGAQLWFTLTETNVEANVYEDEALTIPAANPVIANGVGRFPTVWTDEGTLYRVRIYDPDATVGVDTPLEEYDPYVGAIEGTGTGGGSPLVVTPFDFGAVGANIISDPAAVVTDQATLDASTDDGDALEAFFEDARLPENAHKIYDWSGHWATSRPLFIVLPLVNTGQLNVEYHGRRMICGTLHVLPVAMQPGGVAMDTVLTVSGPYSDMQGHLMVHAGDRATSNYVDRRFNIGVRFIQMAEARLEKITVTSAKHKPWWIDAQFETWDEGDIGAPYPTGSTSKNSIGFQIGHAYSANCGSCNQFNTDTVASGRSYNLTVSAKAQGGDPLSDGVFENAVPSAYNSSGVQRTRLTVATTGEMRVGDFGRMRMEIPAATFTTIAADNGASTFTWTAGDPVAAGLDVGQKFHLGDGSNVGANDGTTFTIVGFSGGSNRVIQVWPKPTTEAAKAYTALYGEWSLHRIMTITDATKFLVYPWVPDGANSKWYHISGAGHVSGNDAANVQFGFIGSIWSGICLNSMGLYGVVTPNLLADHCDIGVAVGADVNGSAIGTDILHSHIEGAEWSLVQLALTTNLFLRGGSVFDRDTCIGLQPRGTTADALQLRYGLTAAGVQWQGQNITTQANSTSQGLAAGDVTVTNAPNSADQTVGVNTIAITVDLDQFALRQGYAQARVLWQGTTLPAPTGTATVALSAAMAGLGWTISGATSVSTPSGSVLFRIVYDKANKRVFVTQVPLIAGAGGNSGPWTGSAGVTFTDRGGGEFDITKTSADAWQGQAWFRMDDDFRLRFQPLQTTSLMSIGMDDAGAVTVDNGTMDAFVYFLTGPPLYQPYKTGYTADTASSSASFAANDYFWFERRGGVLRIFKGGPTFEDSDLVWTHTVDVSASDYVKLLIRDASAAFRVKRFDIPPEPAVVAKSATYTEKVVSGQRIILATGTWTLNLPTAVGNKARITVRALTGTITLDGSGAETINGSATLAISGGNWATIISDGTNWQQVG